MKSVQVKIMGSVYENTYDHMKNCVFFRVYDKVEVKVHLPIKQFRDEIKGET